MIPLEFIVSKFSYNSGILTSFSTSKFYKILLWIIVPNYLIYVITETSFFFANLGDIYLATACMGTFAFTMNAFIRVILILVKNKELKSLIDEIRDIYKNRPSAHFLALNAEKNANYLSWLLLVASYLTLVLMSMSPFVNMFFEYQATGQVVKSRWDLPYRMM